MRGHERREMVRRLEEIRERRLERRGEEREMPEQKNSKKRA